MSNKNSPTPTNRSKSALQNPNLSSAHSAEEEILGMIKNERLLLEKELDAILGNIPNTTRASNKSASKTALSIDYRGSKSRQSASTLKNRSTTDLRLQGCKKAIEKLEIILKEKERIIQSNIVTDKKLSNSISTTQVSP